MPTRPLSHEQRLRQRHGPPTRDYRTEEARRLADPAHARAKRIRSTARWQKVRLLCLHRNPLCADPWGVHAASGHYEVAVEVDHIQGLSTHPELAYVLANLQGLCRGCHARKSAQERRQGE